MNRCDLYAVTHALAEVGGTAGGAIDPS